MKLGDVCDLVNGDRGKNYPSKDALFTEGIPFINAGNLRADQTIACSGSNFISEEKFALLSNGKVRPGDILFCLRGSLGKFAVVDSSITRGAVASSLVIIRPNEKIYAGYLKNYLKTSLCENEIKRFENGAAQPNLSAKDLKDFKIPLPPLKEQKRIAAILDKADAIRRKRQQAILLADDFLRSVFLDMFGDPVTNPKGWEVEALGSHLNAIESGASPKCESRPAQVGEWGVLKLGAVSYCKYVPSENKAIFHDYEPNPKNEIKKGDFLFTRKNTHELVAASALVESTPSKMLMPDLIFRLQPKYSLNRFYLWALLTHSGMRKKVQSYASGAAGSMPNISKENLRTIKMPIPPVDQQNRFQSIYQNVSKLSHKINSSTEHIESQFFSLSQKAFSGKI